MLRAFRRVIYLLISVPVLIGMYRFSTWEGGQDGLLSGGALFVLLFLPLLLLPFGAAAIGKAARYRAKGHQVQRARR